MKFTIREVVTYELEAPSAQDALAQWLAEGNEAATFTGVHERDVLDEHGQPILHFAAYREGEVL